jgi:hypothetical protein
MPYLGNNQATGQINRRNYTATAGQTDFAFQYTPGYVEVFLNGILLVGNDDYTALTGDLVQLTSGAAEGDVLELKSYDVFNFANTYTKQEIDDLVNGLLDGAPEALNTFNELAAALGDDENFASTVVNALSTKVSQTQSNGSIDVPSGTSAERDSTPQEGYLRYNSELQVFEGYYGGAWQAVGGGQMLGQAQTKAISYNAQSIAENITIPSGVNAYSVGNVTIEDGYTVTIENGSIYKIL